MQQDPFKNFKPLNTTAKRSKKPKSNYGDSFVEQLRSIGSSVTNSLKTDVVKGAAQGVFEQLVGSTTSGRAPSKEDAQEQAQLEQWIKEREEQAALEADQSARQQERAHFQSQRSQEKVLFSFADEKLKTEISEVRTELALFVKSMDKVQKQIETAVMQEIVDPGLYHKNFFSRLKSTLVFMRKSMEDASLWLSVSSSRKSQGAFHQNTKKHGTKYSMSQERQMAMSVG